MRSTVSHHTKGVYIINPNGIVYHQHKVLHPWSPCLACGLGHKTALTVHWTVIHSRFAATLPFKGRLQSMPHFELLTPLGLGNKYTFDYSSTASGPPSLAREGYRVCHALDSQRGLALVANVLLTTHPPRLNNGTILLSLP